MPQRWHRRQQNENGRSFPFRLDETEKVEYSEGRPFVPENFRLILASSCISIGCIGIFLESAPITYVCFSQVQISTQVYHHGHIQCNNIFYRKSDVFQPVAARF